MHMRKTNEINYNDLGEIHPIVVYNKMYVDEYIREQFPYEEWLKLNWPYIKGDI